MPTYRLHVTRDEKTITSVVKYFRVTSPDANTAMSLFLDNHPGYKVICWEEMVEEPKESHQRSPAKLRHTYKARMVGVRNNLQSMVEDESELLTQEELIQISRTICELNRIITLFQTRSMDLKREGKI